MTLRKTAGIANAFEKALVLDGSNAVQTAFTSDLNITTALTFGGWMRLNSAGQAGAVIMGNDGVYLEVGSGGSRPSITKPGSFNDNPTTSGMEDLRWHFVAGSLDGSQSRVILDNKVVLTVSRVDLPGTTTKGWTIGAKHDLSAKANAKFKACWVVTGALTATQLRDVYAIGPLTDRLYAYLSSLSGITPRGVWGFNNAYTDATGRGNTQAVGAGTPTFTDVNGSDFNMGTRTLV